MELREAREGERDRIEALGPKIEPGQPPDAVLDEAADDPLRRFERVGRHGEIPVGLAELGIQSAIAANGLEAIEMLRRSHFDLVLMDGQMPTMDGYETTRRLRAGEAGEAGASVRIIAMTANAMTGERERCLANGMDDYIAKPVAIDELVRQLDRWLPRRGSDTY